MKRVYAWPAENDHSVGSVCDLAFQSTHRAHRLAIAMETGGTAVIDLDHLGVGPVL